MPHHALVGLAIFIVFLVLVAGIAVVSWWLDRQTYKRLKAMAIMAEHDIFED